VNTDYEISAPIAELQASQVEEIAKYKWFESQRLGTDIGWTRASNEWFEKHFGDWVREQRRLIDEALSMADASNTPTNEQGVRELQSV
jgi:hypothetical protein